MNKICPLYITALKVDFLKAEKLLFLIGSYFNSFSSCNAFGNRILFSKWMW